jgi:hypothetical protein
MSRKYRIGITAFLALRKTNQNTRAAARLTSVPPASTRRESNALDHATVVSIPDFAPVRRAVSPCPTPSCKVFDQIVRVWSVLGFACSCCKSPAVVEVSGISFSTANRFYFNSGALDGSLRYSAYQSECGDQPPHLRHWVEVHWWRQAGQTPPVSNVFHRFPQSQNQWSCLLGVQAQSGHRMRGPEGSRLLS